jgi:hypothetical protein
MDVVGALLLEVPQPARNNPARQRPITRVKMYLFPFFAMLLPLLCHIDIIPSYSLFSAIGIIGMNILLFVLMPGTNLCTTIDENRHAEVPENLLKMLPKSVPGVSFRDTDP